MTRSSTCRLTKVFFRGATSLVATPAQHGTFFYFLLPYIEQDNVYKTTTGHSYTSTAVIPAYLAPLDPSIPTSQMAANSAGTMVGLTSYEGNGYLFSGDTNAMCFFVGPCVPTNGDTADGNSKVYPTIPTSVSDGTSNTLLCVEHYGYNCVYAAGVYGNHTWGEDNMGPSQWGPFLIHGSPPDIQPVVGQESCYNPHSFTSGGCMCVMVDGSVHTASPSISATTWWQLMLPNDGRVLGSDWE